MTSDAIVDNYMLRLVRDLTPVVLLVMVVVIAFEAFFIKHNADEVQALQQQNMILQQSSAQQGREFAIFLKNFTNEANYECMIAEDRARMDHLPLPAAGTCTVSVP